jgi:hypothetical protein
VHLQERLPVLRKRLGVCLPSSNRRIQVEHGALGDLLLQVLNVLQQLQKPHLQMLGCAKFAKGLASYTKHTITAG